MTNLTQNLSSMGTVRTFLKVGTCSQTMMRVLDRAFERPMDLEERSMDPFAGGIMQHGYQCGMIWGATLAAGAEAYQRFGATPKAEASAILAAQNIVASFRARNHHINCLELTDIDRSASTLKMITYFLIKGGTLRCFHMAARFAPIAFNNIEASLSSSDFDGISAPVSCASLLARRMGVSEQHAVMAAGLAGGIGLCGGACGALGAAIWIIGMNSIQEGAGRVDFKNIKASLAIERFLMSSDYRFECSEIVGRNFENIEDHAQHLGHGGCSKIFDALAAG